MVEAGVIRRVRQTLLATKLAHGALCAWKVPDNKLDAAFEDLGEREVKNILKPVRVYRWWLGFGSGGHRLLLGDPRSKRSCDRD